MAKGLRIESEEAPAEPVSPPTTGERVAGSSALGVEHEARAVVHGKFRILGATRVLGDELAYSALHLSTGRRVDLRLLRQDLDPSSPAAARMLHAARAAGRAPHSMILSVIDSGFTPEQRPFVVYEQFAGVPCTELIERSGPYDLRRATELLSQVLDGLSALHARGLYHRQLRPENVLVDGTSGELRIKLVGLGYSAQVDKLASAPELPRGYSRYVAPEARRGELGASAQFDVYAAGVLLRYLLTGDTAESAALPAEVERALERATAPEPEQRFESADQFRACLSAIVGGSTRETLMQSGSLFADLRYLVRRRTTLPVEPTGAGEHERAKLELYPVLLAIESLYARVGASGWRALVEELPEIEQLLPASSEHARHRQEGVRARLVAEMLGAADRLTGRSDLRFVAELGHELAQRGLRRLCKVLPQQLSAESLTACVPALWRTIARTGEVELKEQREGVARLSIGGQVGASLELSVLFAGMLRGQLRLLSPRGEVNLLEVRALHDPADVLLLHW